MIGNVGLLFLFGMTISSGHLVPRLNHPTFEIAFIRRGQSNGCPSGPELAPLICKFMQQNIDLQYKPKFIAPTTYIPPLVVEKCDSPKLEMEIDLPGLIDEKKDVVIPAPPELPPIMIPKFPVPVIIEALPASVDEPCKTADIPEAPVVDISMAPELPPLEMPALPQIIEQPGPHFQEKTIPETDYSVVEYEPWVVPQAPKLPSFTMPEFPMMPIVVAPRPEDESFAEIPVPDLVQPLAPVPAAPELPPVQLPDFPVHVEIPAEPILPPVDIFSTPMIIEQPIEEPCLNEVVIPDIENDLVEYRHISIPQPPELPTFVMPKHPEIVMEHELPIMAAPYLEDQRLPVKIVPEYIKPVPTAPELPAFVMPELPVTVVELGLTAVPAPCPEDESIPELPTSAYIQPLAPVPAAPELPPAVELPEFPVRVEIPAGPILPPADKFTPSLFIEQPVEEPRRNEVVVPEIDSTEVEYKPMSIPQPPELQAFVIPELPVRAVEQEFRSVPTPCPEDEAIFEFPTPVFIGPLAPIPAAPELPPVQLPEFPVRVEIPEGPILPPVDIFSPPMFINQRIEEPYVNKAIIPEIDNNFIEYNLNTIPQPPKLPVFVMPEFPKIVVEQEPSIMAAPRPEDQPAPVITIPEYIKPLAPVPAAPELPLASLPEFPKHFEIPSGPVLTPNPEEPCLTEELVVPEPEPIFIPQPPKLPEFVMPELPKFEPVAQPMPAFAAEPCDSSGQPILKATVGPSAYLERYFPSSVEKKHKIMIPSQPIDPAFFPTRCVYDFVIRHVIPNIASDCFRSMDSVKALPSPVLPCS